MVTVEKTENLNKLHKQKILNNNKFIKTKVPTDDITTFGIERENEFKFITNRSKLNRNH